MLFLVQGFYGNFFFPICGVRYCQSSFISAVLADGKGNGDM